MYLFYLVLIAGSVAGVAGVVGHIALGEGGDDQLGPGLPLQHLDNQSQLSIVTVDQ